MHRDEYIQVMGDLMILALQTDLTRVSSIMVAPERWDTPLMFQGVFKKPIRHHGWTHNQKNKQVLSDLEKLDHFHMRIYLFPHKGLVFQLNKVKPTLSLQIHTPLY